MHCPYDFRQKVTRNSDFRAFFERETHAKGKHALVTQIAELEARLADATLAMFEKYIGSLLSG